MKRYVKIGLIVGAVGTVGAVIRSVARKSFDHGFESGMAISLRTADMTMSEMAKKYNGLVDEYNRLAEEYCELLDDADIPLDEDSEEE